MNSLKTDINGGFPWVLDDWRWQVDQFEHVIHNLVTGLANEQENARIIGVELTAAGGGLFDVSEGYLLIDGEVVRVDAHQVADLELGFDYYHAVITETFDAAGLKNLEDGGTGDAYRTRRATIEAGSVPVGSDIQFNSTTFPLLTDVIANQAADFVSSWTVLSVGSITGLSANLDGFHSGTFRYKKIGKVCFVTMKLSLDLNTEANTVSFDPPPGIFPTYTHDIGCIKIDDDLVTHIGVVKVTTAPKISISVLSGTMESAAPVNLEATFFFACN